MKNKITEEITAHLHQLKQRKDPWIKTNIARFILDNHQHEFSGEWSRYCIYSFLLEKVNKIINKLAGDNIEEKTKQMIFPGWEQLQTYYIVKRKIEGQEKSMALYVNDLTSLELIEKAELYEKMGRGCFLHAKELREFNKTKYGTTSLRQAAE